MKKTNYINKNLFILTIIIVLIVMVSLFVLQTPLSNVYAMANSNQTEYRENLIEKYDFAEDRVLVVMSEQETKNFNNLTTSDFSEIGVSSVQELTKTSKEMLERQLNNFKAEKDEMEIDADSFRAILCLTLEKGGKENVLKAIAQLKKRDDVICAEPDTVLHIESTNPNDPKFQDGTQWGLNGTAGINAPSAWGYTTGSSSVMVGIIDTGIDAKHPDLVDRINVGLSRDFSLPEPYIPSAVTDNNGHGTHVAGIIGAAGNNEIGITGVAQNIELISLRISPTNVGDSFASHLILAIDYATTANIPILSNSNGTDSYSGSDDSLNAFTVAVSNYPGLFVSSAGNANRNNDNNPKRFPSNISLSNLIAVGAISSNGNRSSFSNYGATTVDIFAPGENIYSTLPGNQYGNKSGTSMAAPHVAGVAALMLSYLEDKPHNMTQKQISNQIRTTIIAEAITETSLEGLCVSGGRLNSFSSVINFPVTIRAMDGFGYNSSWYRWNGKLDLTIDRVLAVDLNSSNQIVINRSVDLNFLIGTNLAYNAWFEIVSDLNFTLQDSSDNYVAIGGNASHNSTVRVGLVSNVSYTNRSFTINTGSLANDTYTLTLNNISIRDGVSYSQTKTFTFIVNKSTSCIAEGSLITLADGSQVAVENLSGDEELLVWNMLTGEFDSAPILFIDSDPLAEYEITHLYFSDGTDVKVIYEHGFWDFDLSEYVFLRNDAAKYIGHWFNKQADDGNGNMIWTAVQLVDVEVYTEYTTAWSPVTFGHLCYYVNGMLSMPGATEGLINIFEVDTATMQFNAASFASDIATYGLFTYEEFANILPVPEIIFEAFNGQYLKVAMGKGLIDWETLAGLIEHYAGFFEE